MVDGKLLSNQNVIQNDDDTEGAETRMRKALGGMGTPVVRPSRMTPTSGDSSNGNAGWQGRQPRRFVRDGEVRVEILQSSARSGTIAESEVTRRIKEAAASLQAERLAREKAERALENSLEARRQLEMRLWHEDAARTVAETALQDSVTQQEAMTRLQDVLISTQQQLEASHSLNRVTQRQLRSLEAERQKLRAAGIAAQRLGYLMQSALIAVTRAMTHHDRSLTKNDTKSAPAGRQDAFARQPRSYVPTSVEPVAVKPARPNRRSPR